MQFKIRLKESVNDINKGILKKFHKDIKVEFHNAITKIKRQLPVMVSDIVKGADEYRDLVSGNLRYELGIPDPEPRIATFIDLWIKGIRYEVKPPKIKGNTMVGSFSASLFKVDFSEVVNTPEAKVYDALRGYELPWLRWLVFYGNIPIVSNHQVDMIQSPRSRTGRALMVGSNRSWSVPASVAGTMADNWITRSIHLHNSQIERIVNEAFK